MSLKKIFAIIAFFGIVSSSFARQQEYTKVIAGNSTGVKVAGIGIELDPHFFSQNIIRKAKSGAPAGINPKFISQDVTTNATAADWDIVVQRVKKMQVQRFRVMVLPEWFEPENDNADPAITDWSKLTFNSIEMKSLYKVLDLAQENGIEVTLCLWGCGTNISLYDPKYAKIKRHFLAENNISEGWVIAPKDNEEWCENFSILIQYLLNEKKYSCVKAITPINEPSYAYMIDDILAPEGYVAMCKNLDKRFRKDGIRDKVQFHLSDDAENPSFLEFCTKELGSVADMFISHIYWLGYHSTNSEMLQKEIHNRKMAEAVGKPHYVGEFGACNEADFTGQRDMNYYVRGVVLSRIMLNFLNAGSAGASYWCLFDQYYSSSATNGAMMQFGLWKYKKEDYMHWINMYAPEQFYTPLKSDYEPRPQYYAYSLLTRFIRIGADVYPLDLKDELCAGTAFKNRDGKWTYIIVNESGRNLPVSIQTGIEGNFDIYRYTKTTLPADDSMIQAEKTITGKHIKDDIELQSIAVYVQK